MGITVPRKHDYPIIRLLIWAFYGMAFALLLAGASAGAYLWIRAEALRDGIMMGGPFAGALTRYNSDTLYWAAGYAAFIGFVGFIASGAVGQILAMARDLTISSYLQVRLLEDVLELNEQAAASATGPRVDLCEGCGRLGSLHRIDSGQWVCRECGRQLRSA